MDIKVFTRIERRYLKKIACATLKDEFNNRTPLEPFTYQPIKLNYDAEGIETCTKDERAFYAIRFTFKNEGTYLLEVTLENGEVKTEKFNCKGFYNNGYVCVSKNDTRYFSYSSGKHFYPLGINLAFIKRLPVSNKEEFGTSDETCYIGMRQYERWFEKCAENGVNVARIWLGHEYFSPDTKDVDAFDYSQFSKIDLLLELAKKYGIKLKLTLEQFRWFIYDKKDNSNVFKHFNKNLYLQGKKCSCMKEWLTDDKWKQTWLNKVKEFAKRYAGDTEIFAVELWNEMNAVGEEYGVLYPEIINWNKEMLPKVRELFPDNMVVTSIGSLDSNDVLDIYTSFPWDNCDFKQMHRYLDQGGRMDSTNHNPIEVIQEGLKLIKDDSKPILVAETGAVNNCHSGEFKFYSIDDLGLIFTDCVYTPVFLQSASCGHMWHWDERYIESKNLYKYFKPLSQMLKDIDFPSEKFESIDFSDNELYIFLLKGNKTSIGFVRNKNASWKNLLRDLKKPEPILQKAINLQGKNLKVFPIWEEDTTKLSFKNDTLILSDVMYGTVFKIEK